MSKVLLIVGPTCVFIDSVRVISNVSSGQLGFLLSSALCKDFKLSIWSSLNLKHYNWPTKDLEYFYTYDELKALLLNNKEEFDIAINCAAISDFAPSKSFPNKIDSDEEVILHLKPLDKLWPYLKRFCGKLVLFKLESDLELAVKEAGNLLRNDDTIAFVVANSLRDNRADYVGRIVAREGVSDLYFSRKEMAQAIAEKVKNFLED